MASLSKRKSNAAGLSVVVTDQQNVEGEGGNISTPRTPRRTPKSHDNDDDDDDNDDNNDEVLATPIRKAREIKSMDPNACKHIAAAYGVYRSQNDKSMMRHHPFFTKRSEKVHSPGSLVGRYTKSPKTPLFLSPCQSPKDSPRNHERQFNSTNTRSLLATSIVSSKEVK